MTSPKARAAVNINFDLAATVSEAAALRGVRAATLEAERILKDILSQPGSGEVYTRGNVVHVASKPGEAPAPDTGRLRNSTDTEIFAVAGGAMGVLSLNTEYAFALEVGTERMLARPHISRIPKLHGDRLQAAFAAFAKG